MIAGRRGWFPNPSTTGRAGRDIASYYENAFESESVAGAEPDSIPHGCAHGNIRYSAASPGFNRSGVGLGEGLAATVGADARCGLYSFVT